MITRGIRIGLCLLAVWPALGGGVHADDEAWRRVGLQDGPSVLVPVSWTGVSDEMSLAFLDPEQPPTAVQLWKPTQHTYEDLAGFARLGVAAERGATIRDVGFRVEDRAERKVAGLDAILTLVALPGAEPPRRSLYVHFRSAETGFVLRFDAAIGRFHEQRTLINTVLASLDAPLPFETEDPGGLQVVLGALTERPPKTAQEYTAWLEELRLIGPEAIPHLRRLARRYVRGPGIDDERARAFLGDRLFAHEIPETVTFRGHPFLQTVEAANEKRWFGPEDWETWDRAQRAWAEARHHVARLEEDHAYRAADQAFSNLAHVPRFKGLHLTFFQARPYALVYITSRPTTSSKESAAAAQRALGDTARVLQALYRKFLRQYEDALGLHDLALPFGGRPDYRANIRSYADGVPLVVLAFGDRRAFEQYLHARGVWAPSDDLLTAHCRLDPYSGRITVWLAEEDAATGHARTAVLGAEQLLYWFTRQRSKWRSPNTGSDCFVVGFRGWFAGADERLLTQMRRIAAQFAERERPYPLLPVSKLLSLTSPQEAGFYATEAGLPAQLGVMLFEEQTWALMKMLIDGYDGSYRPSWRAWMYAVLDRQTGHGTGRAAFARAFRLHGEVDWDDLEAAWRRYVEDELLGSPVGLLTEED